MSLIAIISGSDRSVPNAPTIGTATDVGSGRTFVSGGRADVTFTAPAYNGRSAITSYTVTSNTGGFTGTGSSSPISVTGLTPGNSYTFTVTATNAIGTSAASAASNSITATTIPQVPTITSATRSSNTVVSIAFTGATGGASISAITATSSPSVAITSSGTSSPMTATATYAANQAYTFTITATNANGTSAASNTSGSVTPLALPSLGAWSDSGFGAPSVSELRLTSGASAGGAGITATWVGTGTNAAGDTPVSGGRFFKNEQGWYTLNYPIEAYKPMVQRLSQTSSTNALMGLVGFNSSFSYQNSSYILNMSGAGSWSSGTNYPSSTFGVGFASLNGTGIVRTTGGQTTGTTNYYQDSFGGTWTNSGSAAPLSNTPMYGVDNGFDGTAYYTAAEAGGSIYKVTSKTSAYTTAASVPWGSASGSPWPTATWAKGYPWFLANNSSYTSVYLFTGSSFTAQTVIGGGIANAWGWLGLATNQSYANADRMNYIQISSQSGSYNRNANIS
jgi:hypothetical protein